MVRFSAISVSVLLLLGCGEQDINSVRLTGWVSSPGEDTVVQAIVDDLNSSGATVPVLYEPIQANYPQKLQLMLGTGTAPDVFMLEAYWAQSFVQFDVLEPLDGYIAASPTVDLQDFEPALLDAFRFNGKLYGLPKDYSTLALLSNSEMLAETGLKAPDTVQSFVSAARQLTKDIDGDGKTDIFGFGLEPSLEFILPWVWEYGGSLFDQNGNPDPLNRGLVDALKFLKSMKDEGILAVPSQVGAAWSIDGLGRGKFALAISGLWALGFMDDTFPDQGYQVSRLPVSEGTPSVAFVVGYVMPKSSHKKEAAFKVLSNLTSKKGQTSFAEQRVGLPPRQSVAEEQLLLSDPAVQPFIVAADAARTWQLGTHQRLKDEMETALQAIFLVDEPVEIALARVARRLQPKGAE